MDLRPFVYLKTRDDLHDHWSADSGDRIWDRTLCRRNGRRRLARGFGQRTKSSRLGRRLCGGPAFPTTYEDPLMGIEVNNGWGELKSGQRLSGVEILRVTPDGPGAAAGLQSQRAAVQTALTIALTVGAIFFPPAILGLIEVQQSGLGESHDLIMAVDGQRTRNLDDFRRAIGEAEAGGIVYLTVISGGERNQVRVELSAESR
jgi:S1-C subfamily serine protease